MLSGVFLFKGELLVSRSCFLLLAALLHIFLVTGLVALAASIAVIKVIETIAIVTDLVPIRVIQHFAAGGG
jgi:hypothetical protein